MIKLLPLFLSFTLLGSVALHAQGDFNAVRQEAVRMGETEEGKAYERLFSKEFAPSMQSALKDCTEGSEPPYQVRLVYVIAADGKVERLVADPQHPVSVCLAESVPALKLSPPPKAGWMVSVSITVTP